MKKVSIVGSGNVGVNSAFFIAEMAAAQVTLVDVKEGISEGKALDIMEAAPIRSYRTKIEGSSDLGAVAGSAVVVLAAGKVRTPGHDRGEHFRENAAIARGIADGKYDLIMTSTTPCLQAVANANKSGKSIHVFGAVTDPFGASTET